MATFESSPNKMNTTKPKMLAKMIAAINSAPHSRPR
jgi:hypothetical protein